MVRSFTVFCVPSHVPWFSPRRLRPILRGPTTTPTTFGMPSVTDITGKSQSKHLRKSFEKNRKKEKLTWGRRRCWRWNPGQIQWFQWFGGSSNRQSLLRARHRRDPRAPVRPDGTIRCVWRLLRCRCCSIPTMHQNCPGFVVLAQRKVEKHCWSVVEVLECQSVSL